MGNIVKLCEQNKYLIYIRYLLKCHIKASKKFVQFNTKLTSGLGWSKLSRLAGIKNEGIIYRSINIILNGKLTNDGDYHRKLNAI